MQGQFHLKPHIVHTLANAELYCLALSNIYADPNFHNLNHCGIVNALVRKGVTPEPPGPDCPLTETTLFQTNPLRLVSFDASCSFIDPRLLARNKDKSRYSFSGAEVKFSIA